MSERKTITASLEGMRVLVDEKECELQVYDFVANQWHPKDASSWPLTRSLAESWLAGWNVVDRFAAVNVLMKAPNYPGERPRIPERLTEPRP